MMRRIAALVAALALAGPALAQNMTLRSPDWATRLVAADLLPTTGGRAALAAEGIDLAVRVTVAPHQGGVARVIRYESGRNINTLALRRFTGHPSAGWWLYGPDTPLITSPPPALRAEIDRMARAAVTASAISGGSAETPCPTGERIFVEIYSAGRSTSVSRGCMAQDAIGVLARRLSDAAGSRDEEELFVAAREELLAADRAFNAKAQADGLAAAFGEYASQDARLIRGGAAPIIGPEAIAQSYANVPNGARLTWQPEGAQVSVRGDLGWTWGRATFTPPQGAAEAIQYVTTWTRDYEGNWRYALDLGVPAPAR